LTIILIHGDTRRVPYRPATTVYVCLCHGVTERQIREVAEAGCYSVSELTMRTGVGANCGSCLDTASEVLAQVHGARTVPLPLPVLSHAA